MRKRRSLSGEPIDVRLLICGDRDWTDQSLVDTIIVRIAKKPIECVIHGGAIGADRMGAYAARQCGLKVIGFQPDWDTYGKAAGVLRNTEMLEQGKPTVVIAFHDWVADSKGTLDMVWKSLTASIPTYLITHTSGEGGRCQRLEVGACQDIVTKS